MGIDAAAYAALPGLRIFLAGARTLSAAIASALVCLIPAAIEPALWPYLLVTLGAALAAGWLCSVVGLAGLRRSGIPVMGRRYATVALSLHLVLPLIPLYALDLQSGQGAWLGTGSACFLLGCGLLAATRMLAEIARGRDLHGPTTGARLQAMYFAVVVILAAATLLAFGFRLSPRRLEDLAGVPVAAGFLAILVTAFGLEKVWILGREILAPGKPAHPTRGRAGPAPGRTA